MRQKNTVCLVGKTYFKVCETYKIVHHIVHGDASNGLWQVWINDVLVYDEQNATLYAKVPVTGNFKVGVYMPYWRTLTGVNASKALGVTKKDLNMGTLKVIRKRPTDLDYLFDEYDNIKP